MAAGTAKTKSMIFLDKKEARQIKEEYPRTLASIRQDTMDLVSILGGDVTDAILAVNDEEKTYVRAGRLVETEEGKTGVLFQHCDYDNNVFWSVNSIPVDPEKIKYYGIIRFPRGFCDMVDGFKYK